MAAPTYCEVETQLASVCSDVVNNRNRYTSAKQQIINANTAVGALATTYAGLVTEINAQAAAAPTDVAWATIKARKDKMVAEFNALKATLQSAVNALNAIG